MVEFGVIKWAPFYTTILISLFSPAPLISISIFPPSVSTPVSPPSNKRASFILLEELREEKTILHEASHQLRKIASAKLVFLRKLSLL